MDVLIHVDYRNLKTLREATKFVQASKTDNFEMFHAEAKLCFATLEPMDQKSTN